MSEGDLYNVYKEVLGDEQCNILSQTSQKGARICRHQEHEHQVQQLQQQLQLAQQEHCNLQARLEASKQAAAAREAEAAAAAAAAAAAEQAAKRAAAEAKKQRLASAASAALAGAQPQRSCPGFQPLQLPQQLQPVQQQQPLHQQQLLQQQQQVVQEREGQQALDKETRGSGSPLSPPFPVAPQRFAGPGASGTLVSPGYYSLPSPSYAACVQDMQQQVHALKGSLDRQTDRHKHQRQHRTGRNSKHAARSSRLHTHTQDDGASPVRPKHGRAVLEALFDSEAHSGAESEHEASSSGAECSGSSSDRCCTVFLTMLPLVVMVRIHSILPSTNVMLHTVEQDSAS